MIIYKQSFVVIYSPDAAYGGIPVVIELFIHGDKLVDFHHPEIGYEEFQFILRQFVDYSVIAFGQIEIHVHERVKTQVIACLGLSGPLQDGRLVGFFGGLVRAVEVFVMKGIGYLIEGVYQACFLYRRNNNARELKG